MWLPAVRGNSGDRTDTVVSVCPRGGEEQPVILGKPGNKEMRKP